MAVKEGEVNALAAVELLESSTATARAKGVEAVRKLFGPDRISYRVDELSDNTLHKILELHFRIIQSEKPNYIRAASEHAKTTARKRLFSTARAVRDVVDAVGNKLKQRTASAVLDHIIDTLPDPNGGLCAPIRLQYIRAFNSLLGHASKGEHLRHKQWQTYVDFIVSNITDSSAEATEGGTVPSQRQQSLAPNASVNVSVRISQSSTGRITQQQSEDDDNPKFVLDELLTGLKTLTSITNAPLITRLGQILGLAIQWLQKVHRLEAIAFEILLSVLPTALTEDVPAAIHTTNEICQIVPHIIRRRDLWHDEHIPLQQNILAVLIMCRSTFFSTTPDVSALETGSLERLSSDMQSEYQNVKERKQLQIEDIGFTNPENASLLSLHGINLASETPQATNTWSALLVMSYLVVGISKRRLATEHDNSGETVSKKRKLDDPEVDILQSATGPPALSKLISLQLACFIIDQQKSLSEAMIGQLLRIDLTDFDDEPVTASWSCLLLARVVYFDCAESRFQPDFWRKVWLWASRASAATGTSRAACYLLSAMVKSKITASTVTSQTVCDSIFTSGSTGPSSLTDTALLLLTNILDSGFLDTQQTFQSFASQSLRWLDNQWSTSLPTQIAAFTRTDSLYALLMAVTGVHVEVEPPRLTNPVSNICKALLIETTDLGFTHYMLLDSDSVRSISPASKVDHIVYLPPSGISSHLRQGVIDLLTNKVKILYTTCKNLAEERMALLNLEMIEFATTICVLCHSIVKVLETEHEWTTLRNTVSLMWDLVCNFLVHQSRDSVPEAFPKAFTRIATRLTSLQVRDSQIQSQLLVDRAELGVSLEDVLEQGLQSQHRLVVLASEFTPSLRSRTSQSSQQVSSQAFNDVVRSDLAVPSDIRTLFVCQCFALKLDLAYSKACIDPSSSYGSLAVEAFLTLTPEEVLAVRDVITTKLLDDKTILSRADSSRLLTKLAQVCLEDDEFERCEAALCLCLHIATRLAPQWVAEQDDELTNVGYDIYEWYVNIALGRGIASQRVLRAIVLLLDNVLRSNPVYGTDSLPSARTSLLQILQTGHIGLKFQMLDQLSNLFNGYVLSEHSAVFDDIIDNLPSDPDERGGIVLRLFIVAGLGSRWHTILRQSVYHIFETAAKVPSTVLVAAKCVRAVCQELELESSKHLLRLFSPQVLYTWLETEGNESIAFCAFGYNSIDALRADIQDELVAQTVLRGSIEHKQAIVQSLESSWDGLIQRWFAKVIAYAILTDVVNYRSSREIGKTETSLLQQLGEDLYAKLCRTNLAKAISIIFLRLSDDRGFEKVQAQDGQDNHATAIFKMICSYSSSQEQLPPGQQPSFRAKHLLQILDRMCMRAQETLESVWTPALLVHVYRTLLTDAKPAFGSLHTSAVLRKLRVVICLAGPSALSGYPLQMLLHALRPFITQFHSSEDAFGIFWYLLEQGKPYLKRKLSFATGLSVAIFASLSKFAMSSQESTTQESHFKSTMSKAQSFRAWLGNYLNGFDLADIDSATASTFTEIVRAAQNINKAGSSAKTSPEGSLLYHLLTDQAAQRPLLSDTFFRLTLRSLSQDFEASADFQDDILHSDDDVLKIAPVLLLVLDQQTLQDSFATWVLQALGRAYALRGPAIIELSGRGQYSSSSPHKADILVEDSYRSIVNVLGELLWDESVVTAGASEATLQSIFSALPHSQRSIVLGSVIDQSMFEELRFVNLPCPPISTDKDRATVGSDSVTWASTIVKKLAEKQKDDPVLSFLPALIDMVPSIAPSILPHVVHLALNFEKHHQGDMKDFLTETFSRVFDQTQDFLADHVRLALNSIVHLRRCVLPQESTMATRNTWLPTDFKAAALAALRCQMYRVALLMLEIHISQQALTTSRSSRRSSQGHLGMITDYLSQTYQSIDDPDFFYGTHEESDIASVVEKLCHEGRGHKALSFQSALFDSNIKLGGINFALDKSGSTTISTLNLANFNGLSSAIEAFVSNEIPGSRSDHSLQSLLNLQQWDLPQEKSFSNHGTPVLTALKLLSSASLRESALAAIDQSTLEFVSLVRSSVHQRARQISHWTCLAVLAEMKETLHIGDSDDLELLLEKRIAHRPWTEQESFDCVESILLGREAMFAIIKSNAQLRDMMQVTEPQAILFEIKSLRDSLRLGHVHEMSQFCLNRAAYLKELLPSATELGVKVEAAIQYDLANTLWAQQETGASIRNLQILYEQELPDQAIEVEKSEILTDLGSKIAEARLDRPDEVTAKYLLPAISAIGNERMGRKVGRVFHNFAAFCDGQLRDSDNVEEYERVEKIRDRKLQEVRELEDMYKKGDARVRATVRVHFQKAKTWFKLDDEEMQRLKAHRDRLVKNCLENYLQSLRACDDFPNDVLRFLALWMEQSASQLANSSVKGYLLSVPTYKFAPLMNQLSSRVLNEESTFQNLLSDLIYHICQDHPFHSLYQIFATSKSRGSQKDEVANSRHAAATKLSDKVMRRSSAGNLWISIHNSNIQFVRVAQEKIPDRELKTGSKLLLRKLPQGAKLEQTMHDIHHKIPPPTMKIEIRPDKDYSSVSTIAKFDPQISIAGGVSAPKIVTIIASDGSRHKTLLKGGNDDLRQDSIMEQVFEQVSHLLKDHRPTRQRKLGIRTYKVIPLTHNAGIIEFVQNTMPLHDYLLPAHTRYYPKDYKPNKCRKEIADAQSKSLPQRLEAYRNVVAHFNPVMRFFFMEYFLDPDDWFQKRLNYSRSTAAISMLGHVLGLGDRHGHNILLDTKTGEAVHIDLGVAFEAGRVLPIPEVVPFRLTRDLVDGMGLSGVEGVFRRCCNFTLEALRRNQEAIMTILDVLRWDPLYSWSVSPLRLARMQENQEQAAAANNNNTVDPTASAGTIGEFDATATAAGRDGAGNANGNNAGAATTVAGGVPKRSVNEPSEADRALAVVSRKLGKSLSVEATVNELIRQAMDEQNLAVLYCGWAAYA